MRPLVTKSSSLNMWFFSPQPHKCLSFPGKKKNNQPTFSELCTISHLKGFILSNLLQKTRVISGRRGWKPSDTQHGGSFPGAFPPPGLYWCPGITGGWLCLAWGGLCWESQPGSELPVCFGTCGMSAVGWATGRRLPSVFPAAFLGCWPAVPAGLVLQGCVWTPLRHPQHPDVADP